MNPMRLGNARVRLMVRCVATGQFTQNRITLHGAREAIRQARQLSLDGRHVTFLVVNERIRALYIRGVRQRYTYTGDDGVKRRAVEIELPAEFRVVPDRRGSAQPELFDQRRIA
jgi:hypothetical protein